LGKDPEAGSVPCPRPPRPTLPPLHISLSTPLQPHCLLFALYPQCTLLPQILRSDVCFPELPFPGLCHNHSLVCMALLRYPFFRSALCPTRVISLELLPHIVLLSTYTLNTSGSPICLLRFFIYPDHKASSMRQMALSALLTAR
jgi:hypothetical protein